jgi:hypothetical protein
MGSPRVARPRNSETKVWPVSFDPYYEILGFPP